jgi:phage tail-like protein
MGFSEVTLPRTTISEIPYRENIDGYRFQKTPGLVRYDPITLKRGVTKSRDLYDWLRLVNDELALLGVANELVGSVRKGPKQSEGFRKDVIIEVLDREGKAVKGWYLFNAWPTSYKPGDDLSAQTEDKLVEELTLTYELFLELEGGLKGFGKEILKNVGELVVDQLPFTR